MDFQNLLASTLKIPVATADDPLTAVARGTGIVIENLDEYREIRSSTTTNFLRDSISWYSEIELGMKSAQ